MGKQKKQIEESQEEVLDTDDLLDEDSVSDNVDTSPLEGMSKTNAMSIVMKAMADGDDWVEIFNAVQAQVGAHSNAIPDDAAAKNAASTAMKGAIKEDIATIFGDAKDLSEEFKQKALTIFESAVNSRVSLIESELQEAYEQALEEELESIHETMIEEIDQYLSFAVEEWAEENKVEIETSLRAQIAESFIDGLATLMQEHNFDIAEENIDLTEAVVDELNETKQLANELYNDNIELTELVEELQKDKLITVISENLTPTETEKFKTLVEGFDFEDDVDSYVEKLSTIKEHHFGKKTVLPNSTKLLTEEIEYTEEEVASEHNEKNVSPNMKRYVDSLKATNRNKTL
jgi:hypothetical protein